ncbi:hypothetical protein M9458_032441, partial [Cirrhinus mrigala]
SLVPEVLLSVGSSRAVIFEGGPRPWPPAPFRFFRGCYRGGIEDDRSKATSTCV